MMRLSSLYIIQRIMIPFMGTLFIFLLALSLERSLRLVEEITAHGAPLSSILSLLIYLLPHYLGLAIPAALFIGIMLGLRALQENSERVIIHATGQSLRSIWQPVLGVGLLVTVFVLGLVSYLQPLARYEYRAQLHALKQSHFSIPKQTKVFQRLNDETVFRVERSDPSQNLMQGFFAYSKDHEGKKTIIQASQAMLSEEDPDNPALILTNGQLVTKRPDAKASIVEFDRYPWKPQDTIQNYGPRGQDERELTLIELASGKSAVLNPQLNAHEVRSELHARLAHTFSLPLVCLIAIPLAFMGQGRTGKAHGIIIGVIGLVAYEKILGFGENFATSGAISPWIGLWTPVIILIGASLWLLRAETKRM